MGLEFSRDGQWVTYISFPEGTLWRSKSDGSERLQLTFLPMRASVPRWSPDNTQIAFSAYLPGTTTPNIYLISSKGGTPQQILQRTESNGSQLVARRKFARLRHFHRDMPIYNIDLKSGKYPLARFNGFLLLDCRPMANILSLLNHFALDDDNF